MNLKEDDVVLCKVKKIEGTTVFLEIEGNGIGSMILPEVSAGRIRNLRQYVSPGRIVVCKVLSVNGDHVELSLRRVTAKERDAVLEEHKKEKMFLNILKVVSPKAQEIINKIKEEFTIIDFLKEIKKNPSELEKYLSKSDAEKVAQRISEKTRKKIIEKEIKLTTNEPDGIDKIKKTLEVDAEIHYLGSSRFQIKISAEDFKEAKNKMQEILEKIEKAAHKEKINFEISKEK